MKWILELPAGIIRFLFRGVWLLFQSIWKVICFPVSPFFRMVGPVLLRRPGVFFAVLSILFSLTLFASEALEGFDGFFSSFIFQLGYKETKVQDRIWILKKDEKTSALINKPVTRRDFASILRQIGRRNTMKVANQDGSETVYPFTFLEMKFGLVKKGDNGLFSLPLLFGNTPDKDPGGTGLFSFSERFLSLLRDFYEAPDLSRATVSLPEAGDRFFRNMFQSFFSCTVKLFPRKNLVCQVSLQMIIDRTQSYSVPPAGLIGWDILLQGRKETEEDALLEKALEELETPIVLAAQVEKGGSTNRSSRRARFLEEEGNAVSRKEVGLVDSDLLLPDRSFMKKQAGFAFINATPDSKSFINRMPLFTYIPSQDRIFPGFSLFLAVKALDKEFPGREKTYRQAMEEEFDRILPLVKNGTFKGGFRLADRFIPTDSEGNMYLYFLGSTEPTSLESPIFKGFHAYEAFDDQGYRFYQNQNPEKAMDWAGVGRNRFCMIQENYGNRILLFGTFEKSDSDFFPTPMTIRSPLRVQKQPLMGIEIHANALANILDRRYLRPPSDFSTLVMMVSTTLLLGVLIDHLTALAGGLLMLLFLGGMFGFSFVLYHHHGQMFLFSPMCFSYPLTWAMAGVVNEIRERRRANETKGLFQRFVAPMVVQYLIDHPGEVRPGGQKKELSVYFSDLAGFTTISEALSPEALVELMNEYLGEMTRILFKHGGTLDKYIGDAVMAYWNFPQDQPDHAVRACLYALECHERLAELQKDWARRGLPKAYARAGINTAKVVVGCVGSEAVQMNFTLLGDGVNLASRLEGANKEYGTLYMISDSTYQLVKDHVATRFLDFLAVKGKKDPVKVHQLVAAKGKEPPGWNDLFSLYQRGIDLHLDRQWDPAIACFEAILQRWPEDGPSKTYLQRCKEYKENPPPRDWDGSYHLTHK